MSDNRTMTMMATMTGSREIPSAKMIALETDLREWWKQERTDWDVVVAGANPKSLPGGADLWDGMPILDSKAVARTSPIFERHLGAPLDVKLIRPGGYSSIRELINDLLPKMRSAVATMIRHRRHGG